MKTLRSILSGKAGRFIIVLLPITAGVAFLMACSTSSERNAGGPAGAEVGTTAAQESAAQGYQVARRGEDFSVHEKVREAFDESGSRFWVTNQYTQLENGINYNENGQWRQSEDLIEPFPGGAVARRGPHKAIFSHDLSSEAVFDLQSSDGVRLRGGVRAIQITDYAAGRSIVVGTVKAVAPGELLPPNRILFTDSFDGVKADTLFVWRHNSFSQNVILREKPRLPDGFVPESSRLEIITEFIEAPKPGLFERRERLPLRLPAPDHTLIEFGRFLLLPGTAYAIEGPSLDVGGWRPDGEGTPVRKEWQITEDGRRFLLESAGWNEVAPVLNNLPLQQAALPRQPIRDVAAGRSWPQKPDRTPPKRPIQVARADLPRSGLLMDAAFTVTGTQSSFTFTNGCTYYVSGSFTVGPSGTAVFEPGCVIKYNDFGGGAYMILSGGTSFPSTLQTPVFTSKNDNAFGESISGSSGDPSYSAYRAFYVYNSATVKNVRIRWCHTGIEFNFTGTYALQDSLFENCTYGVLNNTTPSGSVTLTAVQKCSVGTPSWGPGPTYGSMSDAPSCLNKQFYGLNSIDDWQFNISAPEDPIGAVSGTRVVQAFNKGLAVYDYSVSPPYRVTTKESYSFFGAVDPGDPRIIYDWQANTWVALIVDRLPAAFGRIRLAVSKSSQPTPLDSTQWDFYNLNVQEPNWVTDYPTLGYDGNGYYIAAHLFQPYPEAPTITKVKVLGIRKPVTQTKVDDALFYSELNVLQPPSATLVRYIVQPAVNYDTVTGTSSAWFVAKGAPNTNPGGGAKISFFRLQWSGSTTAYSIDATPWSQTLPGVPSYFDGDGQTSFEAPQKGGSVKKNLYYHGSKLQCALIRNGYLWTCHQVGINNLNGNGVPDYLSSGANRTPLRSGIQWMKVALPLTTNSTVVVKRIADVSSTSAPYWYYYPSLGVNAAGDAVIGFSGSSSLEYIGGFYIAEKASGVTTERPVLIHPGRPYSSSPDWGHYSSTFADNGGYIWTFQEFAIPSATYLYSTCSRIQL